MLLTLCKVQEAQRCFEFLPETGAWWWFVECELLGLCWAQPLSPGTPEHQKLVWFPSSLAVLLLWFNKLDLCLRSTVYLPPKFSLIQVKKCKGEQREHVLRPAFVPVSRLGISNVSYLMSPL